MKKLLIPMVIIIILVVGFVVYGFIKSPTSAPENNTSTQNTLPSDNIYLKKTDSSKGSYMTDFAGMTLYTFEGDKNGVSNCTGSCLVAWPIYTSGAVSQGTFPTNISVITRSDGSKQFAWKGMPLYYFTGDKKAGDITGDNLESFHIIKL